MTLAQLQLPGGTTIQNPPQFKPDFTDLGSILTGAYEIGLYIAAFLMVWWMAWGAFEYILAGGDKNKLASARKRIIFAIVGFLLIALAYAIGSFLEKVFPISNPTITNVTLPTP